MQNAYGLLRLWIGDILKEADQRQARICCAVDKNQHSYYDVVLLLRWNNKHILLNLALWFAVMDYLIC